jgi:uncharacterized RDD family membrane protein YckC
MAQGLAESSYLLADKALHEKDAVRSIRTYARELFAEIAVRIVAYGCDLILILFAMTFLDERISSLFGKRDEILTATWIVLLCAYFAGSWAGPLRATPFQFLFRMRVLHESGRPLTWLEATVRSATLVALWWFAIFVLRQLFASEWWLTVVAVVLLFYLPSVTARRQGIHDFLAHSMVINTRAVRSVDDERRMIEYLDDREVAVSKAARPSIPKMIIDAVVLAIPLYVMMIGIQVAHQKNMYGRVAYAMGEAYEMRRQAQAWFEATGTWPSSEADIGRPLRHNYPAGGYYELEEEGVIRIQFEIRPELKDGSILIEPVVDDGEVTWQCRTVGDVEKRYVPGSCRN